MSVPPLVDQWRRENKCSMKGYLMSATNETATSPVGRVPCVPLPVEAMIAVAWTTPMILHMTRGAESYDLAVYGVRVSWEALTFRVHFDPTPVPPPSMYWVRDQFANFFWDETSQQIVVREVNLIPTFQSGSTEVHVTPVTNPDLNHAVGDLVTQLRNLGARGNVSTSLEETFNHG